MNQEQINELLANLRELTDNMIDDPYSGGTFARAFATLDDHLSAGGLTPEAWTS